MSLRNSIPYTVMCEIGGNITEEKGPDKAKRLRKAKELRQKTESAVSTCPK